MGGTTAARLGSSRQESGRRCTDSVDPVGFVISLVTGQQPVYWVATVYWVANESLAHIVHVAHPLFR